MAPYPTVVSQGRGTTMHRRTTTIWKWVYPDGSEVSDHDYAAASALGRSDELAASHGGQPHPERIAQPA